MEAELKEGVLLPELLAVLPGTFVDETREAGGPFPETYSEPKLAGKEATIRATVRGVKEKVLAALDDPRPKLLSNAAQQPAHAHRGARRAARETQERPM